MAYKQYLVKKPSERWKHIKKDQVITQDPSNLLADWGDNWEDHLEEVKDQQAESEPLKKGSK